MLVHVHQTTWYNIPQDSLILWFAGRCNGWWVKLSAYYYPFVHYSTTEWSKSLCAPDDYSTIIRCTKTFWSPCI